jgi:GAF domain-containing protein
MTTTNPYPPIGVPHVDVETSREAAESMVPHFNRLEILVLNAIRARGAHGATDDELELMTGLSHQTASARRRTLVLKEAIHDSTQRRLTRSGRRAIVWVVNGA